MNISCVSLHCLNLLESFGKNQKKSLLNVKVDLFYFIVKQYHFLYVFFCFETQKIQNKRPFFQLFSHSNYLLCLNFFSILQVRVIFNISHIYVVPTLHGFIRQRVKLSSFFKSLIRKNQLKVKVLLVATNLYIGIFTFRKIPINLRMRKMPTKPQSEILRAYTGRVK